VGLFTPSTYREDAVPEAPTKKVLALPHDYVSPPLVFPELSNAPLRAGVEAEAGLHSLPDLTRSTITSVDEGMLYSVNSYGGFSFATPTGWKLETVRASSVQISAPEVEGMKTKDIQIEVRSGGEDGGAFNTLRNDEPDSSLEPGAENLYKSRDMAAKQNITVDGYPGLLTATRNLGSGECYKFSLSAVVRYRGVDYEVHTFNCEYNYEKTKAVFGALLQSWKFN